MPDEPSSPRLTSSVPAPRDVRISRARHIAFVAWIGVSSAMIGIGFFVRTHWHWEPEPGS